MPNLTTAIFYRGAQTFGLRAQRPHSIGSFTIDHDIKNFITNIIVFRWRLVMAKQKAKKGPVPTQNTIIARLDRLAGISGYVITQKSTDKKLSGAVDKEVKDFRPDLIIDPYINTGRRVYEVEKTVSNNTIFKSLISLLYFLQNNPKSEGTLVVPDKRKLFAETCLGVLTKIIRSYDNRKNGAPIKIRVAVISFGEVTEASAKAEKWLSGGKIGQPPKCKFLPRV